MVFMATLRPCFVGPVDGRHPAAPELGPDPVTTGEPFCQQLQLGLRLADSITGSHQRIAIADCIRRHDRRRLGEEGPR